jgi:hypothetical protein
LSVKNSSNTSLLHVRDDGYVGIGTSIPATMLNALYPTNIDASIVQGIIRLTGQSATENSLPTLSAGTAIEFYNKWNGGGSNNEYAIARISGRGYPGYKGALQIDVGNGNAPGQSNYTTAMTILPNGDVGIGTNSTSYKLHVNGTAAGTSWVNSSDMRLKNIAETYSSVDKINTILYEWKDGRDDRVHIGYGAQDVEKILPDAVYTDSEGMKAVNYDEVHTYKIMQLELVVKELQRQNEELQKLISRKRRIRH